VSGSADIATLDAGVGKVLVEGLGSVWNVSNHLNIGLAGQGTLDITNGGLVSSGMPATIGNQVGASGTVNILGLNSVWNTNGQTLIVANAGIGRLNLIAGGVVHAGNTYIGNSAAGDGKVTLLGAESRLNVSGELTLGHHASSGGVLEVFGGSSVFADNAAVLGVESGTSGSATVDGADSVWNVSKHLNVGLAGQGTLNITNGGLVSSGMPATIGNQVGASGTVDIQGLNSVWNTNGQTLIVANAGFGRLNLIAGGVVHAGNTYIGNSAAGDGKVTLIGAESRLNVSGELTLGHHASSGGVLEVFGGSSVFADSAVLGVESGAFGIATVDGADSVWIVSNHLNIGLAGQGILNITNGGLVSSSGGTTVGVLGTLNLSDGTLQTSSLSNNGGAFNWISGTLAAGTVDFSVSNTSGTLSPGGNGVGTSALAADYTQTAGGAVVIDLGGHAAGTDYDQVTVANTAQIAGRLDVRLFNGFMPSNLDAFDILLGSSVAGQFNNQGTLQTAFGTFDVHYTPTSVQLSNFVADPLAPAASIGSLNGYSNRVLGGPGITGGVEASFQSMEVGVLTGVFDLVPVADLQAFLQGANPAFAELDFTIPVTGAYHFWDLEFVGEEIDDAIGPNGLELVLGYSDVGLSWTDELLLRVWHFEDGHWSILPGSVDPYSNTITVMTPSLSPFGLSMAPVPEPSTSTLSALGIASFGWYRRRRKKDRKARNRHAEKMKS